MSVTEFLGHFKYFCQKVQLLTCDVTIRNITGLYDIMVCIMSCSIMSATVFIEIWDILLSKTAEVYVNSQFVGGRGACDVAVYLTA